MNENVGAMGGVAAVVQRPGWGCVGGCPVLPQGHTPPQQLCSGTALLTSGALVAGWWRRLVSPSSTVPTVGHLGGRWHLCNLEVVLFLMESCLRQAERGFK